jgi:phosphotransferase family enzyme
MAKDAVVEIAATDVHEHPARIAWSAVAPRYGPPSRITLMKETRHSAVYRLEGSGPGGIPVIAKRAKPAAAAIERTIYEDILPNLPVSALHLYGFLNENGGTASGDRCWLFLEDAGGEKYSYLSGEHRELAGRWLGAVHFSAARGRSPAHLPDRSSSYYLSELRSVRETIRQSFANPVLKADDRRTLESILAQFDVLESHWGEVAQVCDRVPPTLVHGDLAAKNARVRASSAASSLLIIDWAGAGWGAPAIDLAQFTAQSLSPDLATYAVTAGAGWLHAGSLTRIAAIGNIFRLIVAMGWESQSLSGMWLERPIRTLRLYQRDMADRIQAAGWGDR